MSQQIEENSEFRAPCMAYSLAINFVGAVLGLSWSLVALAIAAWCGNHYGADKPQARAVLGIGLACLSFACECLLLTRSDPMKVASCAVMHRD